MDVGIISFAGQIPILLLKPIVESGPSILNLPTACWWPRRRWRCCNRSPWRRLAAQGSCDQPFGADSGTSWRSRFRESINAIGHAGPAGVYDRRSSKTAAISEQRDRLAEFLDVQRRARLVGPAIAGLIYRSGPAPVSVFLIDGISYLAVIAALLAMKLRVQPRPAHSTWPVWHELGEGLRYSFQMLHAIRVILLTLGMVEHFWRAVTRS